MSRPKPLMYTGNAGYGTGDWCVVLYIARTPEDIAFRRFEFKYIISRYRRLADALMNSDLGRTGVERGLVRQIPFPMTGIRELEWKCIPK